MLRHLRLARARGSLTAPNNAVQDRALEYLDMLDQTEREERRLDRVKALWVNQLTDKDAIKSQFPEYFDPFETAKDEHGEYDIDQIDDSQVDWATAPSAEADEELSRWISEHEQGSFSGADFEQGTTTDWN